MLTWETANPAVASVGIMLILGNQILYFTQWGKETNILFYNCTSEKMYLFFYRAIPEIHQWLLSVQALQSLLGEN